MVRIPHRKEKKFLSRLSKLFGTEHHSPTHKQVTFDYDGRKATIPTYSFRHEVMSLLHDPSIMSKQNIVAGYDIFTGLVDGSQFWKPNSSTTSQYIPDPVDPSRKIRDITSSVLFQNSVERFCTRPHQPGPQVELVHQVKEKECQDKIERASGQPPKAESTRYSPRTTKRWGVAHVTGATTRPTKKYRRRTAQNEALTLHRVEREDQGQDGRTGWGG